MEITRDQIEHLAKFFEDAARGYRLGEDGQYLVNERVYKREARSFDQIVKDFERLDSIENICRDQEGLKNAKAFLEEKCLHEFNYVARGSTALAYESHNTIIRVGPYVNPSSKNYMSMFEDLIRPVCPFVLQPYDFFDVENSMVRLEILPFVALHEDYEYSNEWCSYDSLLKDILKDTNFSLESTHKDLAVLPDGTPVFVDPGCINYRDAEISKNDLAESIKKDFVTIAQRVKDLDLPEPLSWFLPDGQFKQQKFFPFKPAI